MSNFIKTFKQYLLGEDRYEDEKEKIRHGAVRSREQEQHRRVLATGDKEGDAAEKIRHRAAKRSEQQRHIADRRSKYRKPGHRTTSGE